ncbi:MAG: hypothetical protein U0996_25625 [Planctomycetaceae bacterium]
MPQNLTLNISAKVEKGPEIKSEAKFEISNYAPLIEEQICRCSTTTPFDIPTFKTEGLQVFIAADKYYSEKDCVANPARPCEPKKFISYQLTNSGVINEDKWMPLQRPQIFSQASEFDGIAFKNDLTIDVKISVLVFRITPESCSSESQNGAQKQQVAAAGHGRYNGQREGRETAVALNR